MAMYMYNIFVMIFNLLRLISVMAIITVLATGVGAILTLIVYVLIFIPGYTIGTWVMESL